MFPVEAIVTYCIISTTFGLVCPPPITPLVPDDKPPDCDITAVVSPKSVASPVEAIVI